MSLTLFNKRRFSAHSKPVFAALTALLMLSACESTEENEELRIAELEPINIKRHVEVGWRSHYADGVENYYSNLRPVVVGNTIFTASREGEVVAMSADEGDLIWKTDARLDPPTLWDDITFTTKPSAKLNGGVTAAYNNLYVGSENGEVIALSQDEGKILWRAKVKGEVVSAPAAGDGWIAVTTTSGHLAVLHPDTGEERWTAESSVPALSLRGTSSPVIAGGGVLVGSATGKLEVYILATGIPAWNQTVGRLQGSTELERLVDVDTKPVIVGNRVYVVGYNGNVTAIDIASGRVIWNREYSSYRNLTYDQGTLYLTNAKGAVVALDAQNGIEKWSNSTFYNRRLTQPVIYKDLVVAGDFEGYFHFLDAKTGEIVSRFKLDDIDYSAFHWTVSWFTSEDRSAYTAPVVKDDLLYIQTRDGEVTALSLP